jgi:Flp pilus assembly protein TadG
MGSLLHRFLKSERGNAVVEAAFVLPLFLLFVLGIVEFGRLYWVRSSMQLAVSEAGRHVMLNSDATDESLTTIVNDSLYGLDSDDFTLTFTDQVTGGISFKAIRATYQYNLLAGGILHFGPITLTATSTVPVLP